MELLPKSEHHLIRRGAITRPPWMFPVEADYAIYEHCIFVWSDFMKLFGGDFDGDQLVVFPKNVGISTGYSWPGSKMFLQSIMKAPEKKEVTVQGGDWRKAACAILDSYSNCGKQHNNCKIFLEVARKYLPKVKLLALEAKMSASIVQPYIDGLKYQAAKMDLLSPFDLATIYLNRYVKTDEVKRATACFNAARGTFASVRSCLKVDKPSIESHIYYERLIAANFKGWLQRP